MRPGRRGEKAFGFSIRWISYTSYNRGGKFAHYRKLATLLEYVLITQTKPHIEHYIRQPDNQWLLEEAESFCGTIHFPAIDCHLSLAEAYDKVDIGVA